MANYRNGLNCFLPKLQHSRDLHIHTLFRLFCSVNLYLEALSERFYPLKNRAINLDSRMCSFSLQDYPRHMRLCLMREQQFLREKRKRAELSMRFRSVLPFKSFQLSVFHSNKSPLLFRWYNKVY